MFDCRLTDVVICMEGCEDIEFNGTFKLSVKDTDIPDKSNDEMISDDLYGFITNPCYTFGVDWATKSPLPKQNSWVNKQSVMSCMLGGAVTEILP